MGPSTVGSGKNDSGGRPPRDPSRVGREDDTRVQRTEGVTEVSPALVVPMETREGLVRPSLERTERLDGRSEVILGVRSFHP